MPYVSRLVGIDIGVFDNDFAAGDRFLESAVQTPSDTLVQAKRQAAAVEVEVKVTAAGNVNPPNPGDLACGVRPFQRDISGSSLQFAPEVKGNWKSQLTQIDARREREAQFFIADLIALADLLEKNLLHFSRQCGKHNSPWRANRRRYPIDSTKSTSARQDKNQPRMLVSQNGQAGIRRPHILTSPAGGPYDCRLQISDCGLCASYILSPPWG